VGLAGIEPATSALSGRSGESRSVPGCPTRCRFRCSTVFRKFGRETQWDLSGRAGTQLLGQSWDEIATNWPPAAPNAALHAAPGSAPSQHLPGRPNSRPCVRTRNAALAADGWMNWSGWLSRPAAGPPAGFSLDSHLLRPAMVEELRSEPLSAKKVPHGDRSDAGCPWIAADAAV
jgi:hypothetical protein